MANKLNLGIEYFNDPETGKPLASGQVYIGQVDIDPAIEANRVSVTLVQEDGSSVAITPSAQPLTIGAGGRIMYSGSPVAVTIEGAYSVKVLDSLGSQIYYVPSNNEADAGTGDTGLLVLNGSFEDQTVTAGLPDNWTLNIGENGDIAIDSTDQAHGLNSLKFTGTDATGGGTATSSLFDVLKGGKLYVSFTYKSSSATSLNKVQVKYYNSVSGVVSTDTVYSEGVVNPTSYTTRSIRSTVPSTAVSAQIILTGVDGSGTTTTATTNFDDIYVDQNYHLNPNQSSTALGGTTAADGANTWAKLAEFTLDDTDGSATASFALIPSGADSGTFIDFDVRLDTASDLYVEADSKVLVNKNTDISVVGIADIKLVSASATAGTAVQLWLRKLVTNRQFILKEIAKNNFTSITYYSDSAWQSADPNVAASAIEVISEAPELVGDVPDDSITNAKNLRPASGTGFLIRQIQEEIASTPVTAYVGVGYNKLFSNTNHLGVTCLIGGTITCYVEHRTSNAASTAYVRVLKNGVQVQEWPITSTTYAPRQVDVTVVPGDEVIFQQYSTSGSYQALWRYLRIYSANNNFAVA